MKNVSYGEVCIKKQIESNDIVGFGYRPEVVAQQNIKAQIINLLHAVRTLMRSKFFEFIF